MENLEIRQMMKRYRVYNYEVAAAMGIAETTFCRKLRTELSDEEKLKIFEAIQSLVRRGK